MSDELIKQLSPALATFLGNVTDGRELAGIDVVQTLWGGYGQLLRCRLKGAGVASVIVKHVCWPSEANHPRGWNSDISHQRKVRSYQVETHWYKQHAARCTSASRVPTCLAASSEGDEVFIALEDLNPAGFASRKSRVTTVEIHACLSWLANFHATYMGTTPTGLWEVGTYWHLATRPEELAVLEDGRLKDCAAEIDRALNASAFLTFVHGDAKLANFCFSNDGRAVAAVDFQYIGGGCGMKDVAYFISSCLDENESERQESALLDFYFDRLKQALAVAGNDLDVAALESDWRTLYPVAWTDFYRFLQGWSPGHWKIHSYSERLAREVMAAL